MILELKDFERFIPVIVDRVRQEVESDIFLSLPTGLINYLYKDEGVNEKTRQRVRRMRLKKGFPEEKVAGVPGVYLSKLKKWNE